MLFTNIDDLERGIKIKTPTLATIVRLARAKVTDLVSVFDKHDLATLVPQRD